MLNQLNMAGKDKVEVAIERFRTFEPPEGYYIAFSGGKDSVVIKALADMAGVKYDAHYNVTSVDPPELVRFVKEQHPDVAFDYPLDKEGRAITMWNLIPRNTMPPTRGIVVWDKCQPWENFSQVEMAWTSFDRPAALYRISNTGGANTEKKIHPTQKLVALYKWLLSKYAKEGDKILDTHVGSASSLIACYDLGFEYMGFEIDKYYYDVANERLEAFKAQMRMF